MKGIILRKIVWFGPAFRNILREEFRKNLIEAGEFSVESGPKKSFGEEWDLF